MACLELLGMSRAGKTTQKGYLLKALQQEGYGVVTLERPKIPFSEFGSVHDFHSYLIDFFDEEIEANLKADFIILDRGLYDRQVLLDFDHGIGAISEGEYHQLRQRLESVLPRVDKGLVFMLSPEESLRRWESQKTQGLDYSYLNNGLDSGDDMVGLSNLHRRYASLLDNPQLEKIDGGDLIDVNSRKIMEHIRKNGR
jgi:thymidylate kinase